MRIIEAIMNLHLTTTNISIGITNLRIILCLRWRQLSSFNKKLKPIRIQISFKIYIINISAAREISLHNQHDRPHKSYPYKDSNLSQHPFKGNHLNNQTFKDKPRNSHSSRTSWMCWVTLLIQTVDSISPIFFPLRDQTRITHLIWHHPIPSPQIHPISKIDS